MADTECNLSNEEKVALDTNSNPNSTKIEISPYVDKYRIRKKIKICAAIIAILVIICFILLGLLLGLRTREKHNVEKATGTNISELVCLSEECVYTATEILRSMDKTVDPCSDFYMYSCGGWIRNNPIPENLPAWNQPSALRRKNGNLFERLIIDPKIREKYSQNEAVKKMFVYYDACVNTSQINRVRGLPLSRVIAKYFSWNVTDRNWNESNLIEPLATIHRDLGAMPLFKITAEPDYKNSSRNIITIDQPPQMISKAVFLGNKPRDEAVKKAYLDLMNGITALLEYSNDSYTREMMNEIFLLEKNLSKISIPEEDMYEKTKLYKSKTVKELMLDTGGTINWLNYLKILCANVDYDVTEDTLVVTFALPYLKNLAILLENTPKRIIANYMKWSVIGELAIDLSPEYVSQFEAFDRVVMGSSSKKTRQTFCLSDLNNENNQLGVPLGLVFVEQKFSRKSKQQVVEIIDIIRDTFIDNLKSLDWMDDTTKRAAEKKAKAIFYNIGYPEYIFDREKLTKKLAKLSLKKNDYFSNVLEIRRFTNQIMLEGLNLPTSRSKWRFHPQTINAFYDVNNNKMVFPAGILQSPFYRSYPRSVSFGGIGSVIAHEITHAFDNNGRKFNSNGDLVNWWTQASNDAFVQKTQCMISQYSNFTMYGKKTNGKQTLGENIADNNAILQSFRAFKKWQKMNKKEPFLPGLQFSHDQLFFVSAAQIDCGNMRPEFGRLIIDRGTHSIGYVRVIGEMRNSDEFANTFSCPEGSPMNPRKKCKVW